MRMRPRTWSSADRAGSLVAIVALVAAVACGNRETTGAPPAIASCRLGSAVHEHRLADEPQLRASIHGTVVGRLETASGGAHAKDSGSPGRDAIAYHIEERTTLRLVLGPGTVARARLLDGSGEEIALVRVGDEPARVRVEPGEHTLILESDGSRESHVVVHPEACLGGDERTAGLARSASSDDDDAYENRSTPGVYVQEIDGFPPSIVQALTSVPAFVGYVGGGPIDQVKLVTSPDDLAAQFDLDSDAESSVTRVTTAVTQFFAGGGSLAFVVGTTSGTTAGLLGDPAKDTGIHALEGFGWSMLVLPDLVDLQPSDATTVLQTAVPLAASAFAFTLIEPPLLLGLSDADAVATWAGGSLAPALSEALLPFAAAYFPQSFLPSSEGGELETGAVGAIAGAFAANDAAAGVWSAPAGLPAGILGGVTGSPLALDASSVATLANARVNAILLDEWKGLEVPVLTGSSTLAAPGTNGSDVARSRTDLMIRASISEALAWVVFEPADATLCNSATALVASFLDGLWQQGVLVRDTAAQAYDVTCLLPSDAEEAAADDAIVLNVQLRLTGAPEPTTYALTFETES